MNSSIFRRAIFFSSLSIFSASALSCDFCPGSTTLDSDVSYCDELLRSARNGNLYHDKEECDLNIPILAKRCKCSDPAAPRHDPCDLCGNNLDDNNHVSTTISNPGGKLTLHQNKYSCIEMLYSARNGGVQPSDCEALSISDGGSPCGRCIETQICNVDETLCRQNQILVSSNPQNFPGPSDLWSTALSCQNLIESARNGNLLSETGCTTFKNSIEATFMPDTIGLGLFDLSPCGLQCNYNKNAISEEVMGRASSDNIGYSHVPSDGPSLQPSEGPSLLVSEMTSQKDIQSQVSSDMPITTKEDMKPNGPSLKKSPTTGFENEIPPKKQCLLCDFENDSTFYLYKDFGQVGITFFEALSAPDHRIECNERDIPCDTKQLLYTDLNNCYLADVTTFDDLIGIQAVIPPKKAAYIAVYKDTVAQFEDAKSCSQSLPESNCVVENYKQNLVYGYGKNKDDEDTTRISVDSDEYSEEVACTALKQGWLNYGSDVAIPKNIWKNGQPSYCYSGPIQNAAAVWPVQPDGKNYGDMRDVNAGWKLPGAVYKCCKSLHTCSVSTN